MMKKVVLLLSFSLTVLLIFSFRKSPVVLPAPPSMPLLHTIIVDAGHGGSAVGARGAYSFEKDTGRAIAMKLGKKMEEEFPDLKILYTRTSDVYPAIKARADFANANKGDLFVSIHVNAAPKIRHSKFTGYRTETYYTGKGKKKKKHTRKVPKYNVYYTDNPSNGTETFIWAADRTEAKEKSLGADIGEEIYDSTEFVPDINDPEFKAKALLWTKRFFDKSYMLATMVEDQFVQEGRLSRGVKQRNEKGIWVLQATSMPSILVETGFITHRPDEDYLNSESGQETIAQNILNAVKKYRQATEGK